MTMKLMFSSPLLQHTGARCQPARASSGVLRPARAPRVNQTLPRWLLTASERLWRCPHADTDMMQLHLDEISRNVAVGAHAVLLLDRAGWHTTGKLDVPDNITPIFLPSRAPELNPVENVWQYLRQNWLSNTVFENYDAIIDAACNAWRKLTAEPE